MPPSLPAASEKRAARPNPRLDLEPGELVRVKGAVNIVATLDTDGKFEGILCMLEPGEWVEVRGIGEILQTLDRKVRNHGMEFKAEMFRFCGRKSQVRSRLERRVDERTGELRELRNPCILLDSVHCQCSFCSRCDYHWRVPAENGRPGYRV